MEQVRVREFRLAPLLLLVPIYFIFMLYFGLKSDDTTWREEMANYRAEVNKERLMRRYQQ